MSDLEKVYLRAKLKKRKQTIMSSKRTKSLNTKKNALSSVESRLHRDTFCCQRRWCCYATFSFAIQNECKNCKGRQT